MLLALVHWSFCWIWHLPRHCCVLKIGSYAYSFNEDRNLIRIMDDCTYYFCCWGCILARAYFYRSSRFDLGMSFFFSFKLFFSNHKELHLFYGVYGMTKLQYSFFTFINLAGSKTFDSWLFAKSLKIDFRLMAVAWFQIKINLYLITLK